MVYHTIPCSKDNFERDMHKMKIQSLNNNTNNTAFQAKLIFYNMKDNARWEKIAKEFEEKTQRYPDDTFEILFNYYYDSFNYARTKDGNVLGQNDYSIIKKPLAKILETLDNSELVRKLKRLYNLQREKDNICDSAQEFCDKYLERIYLPEKLKDNFYTTWFALENAVQEKYLKKDKLLYAHREHLEIY